MSLVISTKHKLFKCDVGSNMKVSIQLKFNLF